MFRFLETICIQDGMPQHLAWHQRRVDDTFAQYFPESIPFSLHEVLNTKHPASLVGKYKCSVHFHKEVDEVIMREYTAPDIRTLRLLEVPEGYDYSYKFLDREVIQQLTLSRGDADDILMTRGGWITDTSIANIAFRKGDRWYTPIQPLLAGTTYKRLIAEGVLIPRPIHQSHLAQFDAFRVFNAMRDWGGSPVVSATLNDRDFRDRRLEF